MTLRSQIFRKQVAQTCFLGLRLFALMDHELGRHLKRRFLVGREMCPDNG